MSSIFQLDSYDYPLPESSIAQVPASPADSSKLLVYEDDGTIHETIFHTLPEEIEKNRVIFFNDSKVVRSRIVLRGATLTTKDGREKIFDGEIFFLEEIDCESFKTMVYPGDYFPVGGVISFGDITFMVEEIIYEGRILRILENTPISSEKRGVGGERRNNDIWQILEQYGQLPLPPYIEYSKEKENSYQSIFAEKQGSLAAPTASLHFTPRVLSGLQEKGIETHTITLHVGLGTFKNIYEEDIRDYVMHAERAEIPTSLFTTIAKIKQENKTLLSVGTTVTRTLESLPYLWSLVRDDIDCPEGVRDFWDQKVLVREINPLSSISFSSDKKRLFFSSALFIYGEYPFQIVDEIITNFHLPKSTLFILVSSFVGLQNAQKIYRYAREQSYRFFSFGDAMYLKKR